MRKEKNRGLTAGFKRSSCTAPSLHCTALHCPALHYVSQHCTAMHCTTFHCTALHYTSLLWYTLQNQTLNCTRLHCSTLHFFALLSIAQFILLFILRQLVPYCNELFTVTILQCVVVWIVVYFSVFYCSIHIFQLLTQ